VNGQRALLVEDSPEFVTVVTRLLEQLGFAVVVARDGDRAVTLARSEHPDLIVLDVTLPDIDGFEVCRKVREFTDAYVLMVTARHEELDKVVGFSVGADDYVTKPFSARELTARIKAMGRRPRQPADPELRDFGRLRVDPRAREVSLGGDAVDLTKIEFDILDLLSGSPRQTFTRRQLLEQVWGGSWFGDDHVIDVHVGNLRRKLGESATTPLHIRTVRGVGYRFDPGRTGTARRP
jgi:DNA-binding response OmpR family regulator